MKMVKTGIALAAAMIVMALAGCPQPEGLSSDANLSKVTVAGIQASLGTPSEDWAVAAENAGKVYLAFTEMNGAAVAASKGESGQTVYYSHVKPGVMPYFERAAQFNFESKDFLYIEVFSANHDRFLIYAIEVLKKTPAITDITLGGRSAAGGAQLNGIPIQQFGNGVGTPGSAWNDSAIQAGEVWFGTSQSGSALPLTVSAESEGTSWKYAVTDDAAADPSGAFADSADSVNITPVDGKYLYIQSSMEAGGQTETAYYKIKLAAKSDDLAISGVTINGQGVTPGTMGTHSFPGSEAWGNYSNGAELAANNGGLAIVGSGNTAQVIIAITGKPEGSAIRYGYTQTERDYLVDFSNTTGTLSDVPSGSYIALEVTSELGTTGWYKFRVFEQDIDATVREVTVGTVDITSSLQNNTTAVVVLDSLDSVGTITAAPSKTTATVKYGRGTVNPATGAIQPPGDSAWQTSGALFTGAVEPGTVAYIQVSAPTPGFVNTYSFALYTLADIKLNSFTVGGSGPAPGTAPTDLGTPADTAAGVTAPGAITLTAATAAGAPDYTGQPVVSTAVSVSPGLSYRVAQTTGTATPAENAWKAPMSFYGMTFPPTFSPISNNDVLWVEVSAGTFRKYYKIAAAVQ